MKIGLIDVDGHSGFPNLALMRLSAWHKAQSDSVEWWNGFLHYDLVYMSKVFTFSPDIDTVINADEIIRGGTGYKDYGSLPPEIEATAPDYSIYPDFKQGLDARLITPEVARLLARLHWIRFVRMSCDTEGMIDWVILAAQNMAMAGISRSRFWCYVLVQDVAAAHKIVTTLDKWGITPFAQPYRDYDGGEPTKEQRDFARWVNNKAVFRSCDWDGYRRKANG